MKQLLLKNAPRAGLLIASAISFSAYADPLTFGYTGGLQTYTIPATGNYYILAGGAQGGSGQASPGGAGTQIEGTGYFTVGTVLNIIAGGSGGTGNFGTIWGGGGGGGSFVWTSGSTTPLLIAGGGGGASFDAAGGTAAPSYQEDGFIGYGPGGGAGGTAGSGGLGGTGESGNYNGGGGGGWYGNGTDGLGSTPGSGTGSAGGGGVGAFTFLGGVGGADSVGGQAAFGGFGGGGGGGWQGGGGGGGYSGGGGGDGVGYAGGAGGSYLDSSLTGAGFLSGGNQADGFVQIDSSSIPIVPTPEPSTIALAGLGLAGLAAFRRKQ